MKSKRFRPSTFLLFAVVFFKATAFADTFDFSYTFRPYVNLGGVGPGSVGPSVTGTLTGTQVGNSKTGHVTDVSVQSLFVSIPFFSINNQEIKGPIFNTSFSLADGWGASGSGIVSFDITQNNFWFARSDLGSGDFSGFGVRFTMGGVFFQPYLAELSDTDIYSNLLAGDMEDGIWTLTNTTERRNVPDGGNTAPLIALGLSALFFWQRHKSRAK